MTSDERAQLVEDIKKSNRMRGEIVERAETNKEFDLIAAWDLVDDLDTSIASRILKARPEN